MISPTRIFDLLPYQVEKFDLPAMLSAKENGTWRSYSSREVLDTCNRFSAGLLALGLTGADHTPEKADKIAILSNNRPEWVFTDFACLQTGVILCPVYPTTNPNELQFIFNDAEIKYAFVSNEELLDKVNSIANNVPSLKAVYTFDKIEEASHWTEVLNMATDELLNEVEKIKETIRPEYLATIIYTSGTTGVPKGVMLSHQNLMTNVDNSRKSFPFEDAPGKRVLSFLPLNHVFERMVTLIYISSGLGIWYAESLDTIGPNLLEVKPHGFTTVPRLLEKVYEKIMEKGHEQTGIKKKLFFWAVELGLKYDNLKSGGILYDMQLAFANKIVFSKWREGLGGNVEFIVTGGAACQERLLRIFNAGKIPVYEGYGPTENSPVISVNRKETGGSKYGTVGPALMGQEVKLADDGEILVKGPSVMMGYYKQPAMTAETISDGWLHTGDIGVWDGRFLKITDRKKELFKTSGGKYVAPQPIENKLKESPFIEQVMVIGAEQKFVAALIVPGFPTLREWMRKEGLIFTTNEAAIREPKVQQHYMALVEAFNTFFNHVEQVKKFELLPSEWTIASGELTPTLKLKRKVVMEKFRDAVDRIYQ